MRRLVILLFILIAALLSAHIVFAWGEPGTVYIEAVGYYDANRGVFYTPILHSLPSILTAIDVGLLSEDIPTCQMTPSLKLRPDCKLLHITLTSTWEYYEAAK